MSTNCREATCCVSAMPAADARDAGATWLG